jgi:hypothetical protein
MHRLINEQEIYWCNIQNGIFTEQRDASDKHGDLIDRFQIKELFWNESQKIFSIKIGTRFWIREQWNIKKNSKSMLKIEQASIKYQHIRLK